MQLRYNVIAAQIMITILFLFACGHTIFSYIWEVAILRMHISVEILVLNYIHVPVDDRLLPCLRTLILGQ